MSDTFSKTEARRRLRLLAKEARRRCGLPRNTLAEVGHRIVPVAIGHYPGMDERVYADEGDDLDTLEHLGTVDDPRVRAHGAIVHLYLSRVNHWGQELSDVCVGWMGTPDADPALVDTNGRRIER